MADVSVFQIGDQQINVKDKTARSSASSAVTTAQEAATVISSFLELVWQTEPQAIGGKLPDSTFIAPRP